MEYYAIINGMPIKTENGSYVKVEDVILNIEDLMRKSMFQEKIIKSQDIIIEQQNNIIVSYENLFDVIGEIDKGESDV